MAFLLDTNAVTAAVLNDAGSRAARRPRRERPADAAGSAVVPHGLSYRAFRGARTARNLALVDGLGFEVLDFGEEDVRQAGDVRAFLAARGTPIEPFDMLVAGRARARGLALVMRNTGGFGRVPGLWIEDREAG